VDVLDGITRRAEHGSLKSAESNTVKQAVDNTGVEAPEVFQAGLKRLGGGVDRSEHGLVVEDHVSEGEVPRSVAAADQCINTQRREKTEPGDGGGRGARGFHDDVRRVETRQALAISEAGFADELHARRGSIFQGGDGDLDATELKDKARKNADGTGA
jgi:hypothetical protein